MARPDAVLDPAGVRAIARNPDVFIVAIVQCPAVVKLMGDVQRHANLAGAALARQPPQLCLECGRDPRRVRVPNAPSSFKIEHPEQRPASLRGDGAIEQRRVALCLGGGLAVDKVERMEGNAMRHRPGDVAGILRVRALVIAPAGLDGHKVEIRRQCVPVDHALMP